MFMLCRPAELKDKLDKGIEIYTLGKKEYVGLNLSGNKADLTKIVADLKLKTLQLAKIEFADPNNLTAKGQYKLICWEFPRD